MQPARTRPGRSRAALAVAALLCGTGLAIAAEDGGPDAGSAEAAERDAGSAPDAGAAGGDGGVAAADGGPADAGRTLPELRVVTGKISGGARREGAFTVASQDGPVTFTVDRNTSVYLTDRLGTVRDLVPGTPVRAQLGPDLRAYWIEVDAAQARSPQREPTTTAAGRVQLPSPPAPSTPEPAVASDGGTAEGPGREVPAGPGSPEPNPGVTESPPPEPVGPGRGMGR